MGQVLYYGQRVNADGTAKTNWPRDRFLGPPVRCMSLACEANNGCHADAYGNYPPDCPGSLGHDANPLPPVTPETTAPSTGGDSAGGLQDFFSGMSTTTLLVIGAAAYFLFFKKGR